MRFRDLGQNGKSNGSGSPQSSQFKDVSSDISGDFLLLKSEENLIQKLKLDEIDAKLAESKLLVSSKPNSKIKASFELSGNDADLSKLLSKINSSQKIIGKTPAKEASTEEKVHELNENWLGMSLLGIGLFITIYIASYLDPPKHKFTIVDMVF